jgi:hypothetical protein
LKNHQESYVSSAQTSNAASFFDVVCAAGLDVVCTRFGDASS